MQSTQPLNLVFLSLVAFVVSLGLTWLVLQDFGTALFVGIVVSVIGYGTAAIALRQRVRGERLMRNSLRGKIQQLEREETQLYHSLYEATATQEQLEASISALQSECHQLLNRVSELHTQRNSLYQEIANLQQQKQQNEQECLAANQQIKLLEKAKTEIAHALEIAKTQFQTIRDKIVSLRTDLDETQADLSQKQRQKDDVQARSQQLMQIKLSLEEENRALRQQADVLRRQKSTLAQVEEWQFPNQVAIDIPPAWRECLGFARQLNEDERQVLFAILEQNESELKRIADEKTTMPEVLIEALNENALRTLGDTLFASTNSSLIPDVHQEYSPILVEPIEFKFKDFLSLSEQSETE